MRSEGEGGSRDVNDVSGLAMSEFENFPVVSGDVVLTFNEIRRDGCMIRQLSKGEWFATITTSRDGNGFEIATGWVGEQSMSGTLIRLNRTWDNEYWIQNETPVLPIPNPWDKTEQN